MKSHSIWEFPVFWLVDTVVTWPKMRLWEISGLFETFWSDGSLQDTLKVSNRHYWKLFDSLFETFIIWTCNSFGVWISQRQVVCFGDLDTKFFDSLFETFLIWNFCYLKTFVIWNFLPLKENFDLLFETFLKWNFMIA